MKTFAAPQPITAIVDVILGDIRVTASDRDDCTVTIRPRDELRQADVRAAEAAQVEFANNHLTVRVSKSWQRFTGASKNDGAVTVEVSLPTDSTLRATTGKGDIRGEGELGQTATRTGLGNIRLDGVGTLRARTGLGDITVDDVTADATVTTNTGALRLGSIHGSATIKNSNGSVEIAECGRYAHVRTASGDISIGRALTSISAVSAAGDIRIAEVSAGSVTARTGAGAVEIGVRDGITAWLEATARYGAVRNGLTASEAPDASTAPVEIHARSVGGDVTISKAVAAWI